MGFAIHTSEGPLKSETVFSFCRKLETLKSKHKSMLPLVTQIAAQNNTNCKCLGLADQGRLKKCLNEKFLKTGKNDKDHIYTEFLLDDKYEALLQKYFTGTTIQGSSQGHLHTTLTELSADHLQKGKGLVTTTT